MNISEGVRELVEKCPHNYRDGLNCGWMDQRTGKVCGKPEDKGRHIQYGPQEDYPGYHHFEAEQVHDEKCYRCAALALLATLEAPAAPPRPKCPQCGSTRTEPTSDGRWTCHALNGCLQEFEPFAAAAPAEAEKRGAGRDFYLGLALPIIKGVRDGIGPNMQYDSARVMLDGAIRHLELLREKLAAPAPESQRPEPWNPEIESFDVALQRQHDYNAKLAKRVSEATEKEGSNG